METRRRLCNEDYFVTQRRKLWKSRSHFLNYCLLVAYSFRPTTLVLIGSYLVRSRAFILLLFFSFFFLISNPLTICSHKNVIFFNTKCNIKIVKMLYLRLILYWGLFSHLLFINYFITNIILHKLTQIYINNIK